MRPRPFPRKSWSAALFAALAVWAVAGVAGDSPVALRDARRAALPPPETDPFFGVVLDEHAGGARVDRVIAGSAAERAGVLAGDVLARIDGAEVSDAAGVERAIRDRGIGAALRLRLDRGGRSVETVATLGGRRRADGCFHGSTFGLAVVPLRFADDPPAQVDVAGLTRLLFARSGATGEGASLADYYRAQSYGRLDVTGRVLAPVTLASPRAAYAGQPMGGSPESAFATAAAILEEREGAGLSQFDGIAFLYGGAAETRPGFALWPHRSSVDVGGRRLPYYVQGAGEPGAAAIGVHCHEFGHLLGLPDAYGAGHVTGSGDFCLMAIGHRGGGKSGARAPFSLCPWCRMRLGWIDPVPLDPRTPQRIRLDPVSRGPGEVALVPLSPRTEEYLLLEVRRREGFDAELPSAGLLVWHVGGASTPGQGPYGSYVDLVEAHGIDCVDAALVRTDEIAFPTRRARDLTPDTTPAIRVGSGGFPVYLTGLDARADGSVEFTIGAARRIPQTPPAPLPAAPGDDPDYVVRTDPVTGASVRLYVGAPGDGPVLPLPVPPSGAERR